MNNKYPLKQATITGVIVGIFGLVFFSIADSLNHQFSWGTNPMTIRGLTGLLMLVILGIGIYSGMQALKRENKDVLTYKEALIAGVLISFITGVITAVCTFVYFEYINKGFAAYLLSESRKVMVADRLSPNTVAKNLADLQKQLTIPAQVMQAFVGQFVCGTIISLILSIFSRTKNNPIL